MFQSTSPSISIHGSKFSKKHKKPPGEVAVFFLGISVLAIASLVLLFSGNEGLSSLDASSCIGEACDGRTALELLAVAPILSPQPHPTIFREASFYATPLQESTIVVTLAFGNATKTNLVQRMIWSLRTNGGWSHGRIAILTDQPAAYQALVAESPNVRVVSAKESDLYPTKNEKQQPLEFKLEAMRFKRFKTLLLDYLDEAYTVDSNDNLNPYRLAVYIDADIVVARPLTSLLQDFQDQMYKKVVFVSPTSDQPAPFQKTKDTTKDDEEAAKSAGLPFMSMFTDCPTCARHNTNSGFIILHRERSRPCLAEWKELMDDGSSWGVYDQRFLRDLRAEGNCKIHVLPDHHRLYPSWKDMRLLQSATIVHNTNSYNAKKIPAKVQAAYFSHLLNTTSFSKLEFF